MDAKKSKKAKKKKKKGKKGKAEEKSEGPVVPDLSFLDPENLQ